MATAGAADWPFWGGSLLDTRSAPSETAISPDTAASLRVKWVYRTAGDVSSTPTIEGNALYVTDWGGQLTRVDRRTGRRVWTHAVSDYTGSSKSFSRNSPAIGDQVLVIGDRTSGAVIGVDKDTGKRVWRTIVDDTASAIITASPVIANGRVYVGVSSDEEVQLSDRRKPFDFRGSVLALDEATGAILWQFRTMPEGYAGGSVWSSAMVPDVDRGLLYVTTGNNVAVPEAAARCVNSAATPAAELACLAPNDYFDSVVALNLADGTVHWARHLTVGGDAWFAGCILRLPSCQIPGSPDYDFGSGVNVIDTVINGQPQRLIGAGQKSGVYWALDPDDGHTVWATQVGPGGVLGGIMWGSATDGQRVYVAVSNSERRPFKLASDGSSWRGGAWAALDAATGKFLWQIAEPGNSPHGIPLPSATSPPLTVANGVLFAGTADGGFHAVDAASGRVLWNYASGGTVMSGPSVVDGTVYWGSGYTHTGGSGSRKLFAFDLPQGKR